MEVSKPVRIYEVNLYCDKCGGLMKADDSHVLLTYPAQYTYHCDNCDYVTRSYKRYPYTYAREEKP